MSKSINMRIVVILILFIETFCAFADNVDTPKYLEYVDSAEYYIRRELWGDAERMTVAALRQKPAQKVNYILWSNLGDIRSAQENYDGALIAFEIALTNAPDSYKARILNNRAYTLLKMSDEDRALSDINESLELDSVQEWPLKMRGVINLNKSRLKEAERDFLSLNRHYPKNSAAYTGLGKIEAYRGESLKAESYFRRSLELEQDEETWFYLILVNIESDRLQQAKEDLLVALKRYPRSGNFYLLRGLLHKKNYENDDALIDKKIAIDFNADPHLVERFFPSQHK